MKENMPDKKQTNVICNKISETLYYKYYNVKKIIKLYIYSQ